MEFFLERLATIWASTELHAPRLLGAAAFIVVGVVAAWILDRVVRTVCNRLRLDESRGGRFLAGLAAHISIDATPSTALRRTTRWTVIIVATAQAVLILELEAVSAVMDRAVWIAMIVLIVLTVLYVGATLSERLARAAQSVAERDGILPPPLVGGVVRATVLAAVLVIALEVAGVTAALPVVVLAICLTGVLGLIVAALVIGARGLLENILAARYVEEHYVEGQMVSFRSERAQIRSIGLMATVVRTGDGVDHTTPNAIFLKESI